VEDVRATDDGFVLASARGETLAARCVVLAAGGRSLPKSGSDGGGFDLARRLGHSVTSRVFPALVPLTLPEGHFLRGLSGLSAPVTLEVRAGGRRVASFTDALLCTHFGISGPVVLDASRYLTNARLDDPDAQLVASWLPGETEESLEAILRDPATTPSRLLADRLPERLARALCADAGVEWGRRGHQLTREARRALVQRVLRLALPVTGDRGWNDAEVTAGGVPLAEIDTGTMRSRVCPGLSLCGEICDVDGRIGGYNFQWAWASGFVAGTGLP
jgi:predicted Rossmann fold flavoprotein